MHKTAAEVTRPSLVALSTGESIKRKPQAKPAMGFFRSHARRLFTEFLNLFFNHDWLFRALGWLNRRSRFVASVFLAYPATDGYSDAYTYRFRAKTMVWRPRPIGFLRQNGKFGVKFAVSARDAQFLEPANGENLRTLVERMDRIRKLLAAESKTFAGILPGIIYKRRLVREMPEVELTVRVIVQVIGKVKKAETLDERVPIIILGGRGFIGRKVAAALPDQDAIYSVDLTAAGEPDGWPDQLHGQPALLVNISRSSALGDYIARLWPKLVVVNEVYPEPSGVTLERMRSIGCRCYHIVGVKAKAWPSFPGGYEGGIPCCAAWQSAGISALYKRIA